MWRITRPHVGESVQVVDSDNVPRYMRGRLVEVEQITSFPGQFYANVPGFGLEVVFSYEYRIGVPNVPQS